MMDLMKGKFVLPIVLVAVLAISRIPGLMPMDFSVVYAFLFCSGVYCQGPMRWWLPLGTLLLTDLALNAHYHMPLLDPSLIWNYLAYAAIIVLARWFHPGMGIIKTTLGGVLGAVLFYLITSTVTWWQDSYYAKTILGFFQALTLGHTNIQPSSWEFLRNTLLSSALFTALFSVAAVFTEESPADKTAGFREASEGDSEGQPQEAET